MFVSYYLHKFLKLYVSQTKKLSQLKKQPPEVFYRKSYSKKFRNIHRKTPALDCLFNRVAGAGLKICNYIKRDLTKGFSVNIAKILRTPIFKKICKQLLLQFLLLTVNIFSQGLPSAFNSISLFSSRSCLRFKEFSLGC